MPNKGIGKPDYGEPWYVDGMGIKDRGGFWVTNQPERQAACVNACAGLTDEELKRVRAVNEMYEALLQCSRDTFTASGGMSESGKISPAGQRYKKAMAALTLADGREPERGER